MLILISWLLLLIGLVAFTWFFVIRGRGALRYWIRTFEVAAQDVLGRTFTVDDKAGQGQFFTDGNAVVRSLDRRTNTVLRQWDREAGTVFLGLVLNAAPDDEVPEGYELRRLPSRQVVRLSGANRLDEESEVEAVKRYADQKGVTLDFNQPSRISGQSFSLYQWEASGATSEGASSLFARCAEATYQLRNNLVIPLLATWIAVALMGTAQPLLLVAGILLICFLSGACKFVFMHQMTDEADEVHLQNY